MHLPSENPHHTFILHVHQDNCVAQWQFHAAYRSIWVARMQANHPVLQGVCMIARNLSAKPLPDAGRGTGQKTPPMSEGVWEGVFPLIVAAVARADR